jgi:hypothetical protein
LGQISEESEADLLFKIMAGDHDTIQRLKAPSRSFNVDNHIHTLINTSFAYDFEISEAFNNFFAYVLFLKDQDTNLPDNLRQNVSIGYVTTSFSRREYKQLFKICFNLSNLSKNSLEYPKYYIKPIFESTSSLKKINFHLGNLEDSAFSDTDLTTDLIKFTHCNFTASEVIDPVYGFNVGSLIKKDESGHYKFANRELREGVESDVSIFNHNSLEDLKKIEAERTSFKGMKKQVWNALSQVKLFTIEKKLLETALNIYWLSKEISFDHAVINYLNETLSKLDHYDALCRNAYAANVWKDAYAVLEESKAPNSL